MDQSQSANIYNHNRFEIIRLYLIEGWKLEQVQSRLQTKLT